MISTAIEVSAKRALKAEAEWILGTVKANRPPGDGAEEQGSGSVQAEETAGYNAVGHRVS